MTPKICCTQCHGPVTFGKYDAEADKALPGNYRIVAIQREGSAAYGRTASYVNVYTHIGACEAAWRAANGEPEVIERRRNGTI